MASAPWIPPSTNPCPPTVRCCPKRHRPGAGPARPTSEASSMATTSSVFIGDGSLLVQCADAWRQAGHGIEAVVSGNDANLAWAQSQGLRAIRMEGDWAQGLDGLAFDYLFSVANLRMLPPAVLARAGRLAINFHDALLPRYAGLNATS
ncbi:MAG: hypothetical protein EOO24_20955 [Comamonadaceae bacterium]|nr:MAG: hypothetical protein EOO24_20955 [Comamonadaceae bacterium]